MKAIDLLIPSNYLRLEVRACIFLILFSLWGITFYFKFFVFFVGGGLHLAGLYVLWVLFGFLFDKFIPTAPASIDFNDKEVVITICRFLLGLGSIIVLFYIILYAEWDSPLI